LNIEVSVVAVHIAGKHAPKLQPGEFGLEARKVAGNFVDGTGIVFFYRQLKQPLGIFEAGSKFLDGGDDALESSPLLAKRLRSIGFIPDVRLFEFPLNFRQAFFLALIVKDTPLTQQCVHEAPKLTG
jgi:hypothetical protein